ncbi:MAG: hypothetical protein CMJ18_12975 [Phycisphaeraceae bacterium]|nr:hypothetical protein [Phycisphaeraceae bacterium]
MASRAFNALISWRVWAVYLLLFLVGVPWHARIWSSDPVTLWFGMPRWTIFSVGVALCAACYTALLLSRAWPSDDEPPDAIADE